MTRLEMGAVALLIAAAIVGNAFGNHPACIPLGIVLGWCLGITLRTIVDQSGNDRVDND